MANGKCSFLSFLPFKLAAAAA
ncbi:hypothetical protein CCACVL1_13531 [Corchorus capsularis]|uniref:Uncharacterized protein n=1 Tax=Corchorus capsularis TaxID=210143 RepID=A0A1R3IAQ9_COCAP|nr:hypothetical protein CCACVL1_13531 [Corchorus capsularis]